SRRDSLRKLNGRRRGRRRGRRDRCSGDRRKSNRELRTAAGTALHFHLAADHAHVLADLVGAYAHAFRTLGAVEGAEQPLANEVLRHAAAGVEDRQYGALPARSELQPDDPALLARVLRVADQVLDDGCESLWI